MTHGTRARDVAITDFRFILRTEGVVTYRSGRRYLLYARSPRVQRYPAPGVRDVVSDATRRLTEWALYTVCGGSAVAAVWLAFFAPFTVIAHTAPAPGPGIFSAADARVWSRNAGIARAGPFQGMP